MAHVQGVAQGKLEADARREREAKSGIKELLTQRPEVPEVYHWQILRRAYEYHRVTEHYPFNPRCLEPQTLMDIDMEFVGDYELYSAWVQYWCDNPPKR